MANYFKFVLQWKFWKELFIMTLGMSVGAAGVYYFLVPSKLIIGSISGLSIVLSTILQNFGIVFKVSWMVTIINAILLVLAWILIGKEFGAKTVYTAMILGPLMDMWEFLMPYEKLVSEGASSLMGDPLVDMICFVLMLSVSQAILFNINASTGGLDIIAKIVNKYLHLDIGTSVSIAGGLICCTAFAINPFSKVVLGLIGTYFNGIIVDHFMSTINRRKRVCIVSEESEKIRLYILNTLQRGCSLYPLKGGYTLKERWEVQTILTQTEFSDLMTFLKKNNIDAFITAGNVSEVYGMWNHAASRRKRQENQ